MEIVADFETWVAKSRDDCGIELEVEGLADIESRVGGQRPTNLGLTEECEFRLIVLAMMSQVGYYRFKDLQLNFYRLKRDLGDFSNSLNAQENWDGGAVDQARG